MADFASAERPMRTQRPHMTDPSQPRDDQSQSATGRGEGFADIVAEIEAETERRRNTGEYPPELLERLDAEFDRFAPLSFRRTGIDGAIRAVESAAFVNVDPPVASSRRSATFVKKLIKKATSWYHLHIARQVTALGIQTTRPLRMLAESTRDLERRLSDLEHDVRAAGETGSVLDATPGIGIDAATAGEIRSLLAPHADRIVVLGDSDSTLVATLVGEGLDAYGVVPAGGGGLDIEIRAESPLSHLRSLSSATLGGAVLVGFGDASPTAARVEAVRLLCDRVVPGGRLIIVAIERDAWVSTVGHVQADLSPSQPLSTETWLHLLEHFGARAPRLETTVGAQRIIVASAS